MAIITKTVLPPAAAPIGAFAAPFSRPPGASWAVPGYATQELNPGDLFDWRSQRGVTPVEQMVRMLMLMPFMPPLTPTKRWR